MFGLQDIISGTKIFFHLLYIKYCSWMLRRIANKGIKEIKADISKILNRMNDAVEENEKDTFMELEEALSESFWCLDYFNAALNEGRVHSLNYRIDLSSIFLI